MSTRLYQNLHQQLVELHGQALPACLARARNVNKAERAIEREAERALDLQIKHQNLPGA